MIDAANEIPVYLEGYEDLFNDDPRAASLQWFKDAQFGMFVHYSIASQLRGGRTEHRQIMAREGTIEEPRAPNTIHPVNQRLADNFTAEEFDADAICELALTAGMRYINFTTAHCGGMHMYRTRSSELTSLNSPAKRDLVEEVADACRRHKLGLFLYLLPCRSRTDGDYLDFNRTIIRELLTQYGPVAGIWFDGIGRYLKHTSEYDGLLDTYDMIRSLQPHCLISYKDGATGEEDFISTEHSQPSMSIKWDTPGRQKQWEARVAWWETSGRRERWEKMFRHHHVEICTIMQECQDRDAAGVELGGWTNEEGTRHLSIDEVRFLVNVVRSFNANLVLNIGLRGDGSIHPDDYHVLSNLA